jgi:hypothetical protein
MQLLLSDDGIVAPGPIRVLLSPKTGPLVPIKVLLFPSIDILYLAKKYSYTHHRGKTQNDFATRRGVISILGIEWWSGNRKLNNLKETLYDRT